MGTNYRAKPIVRSNVYPDIRVCGMFGISASTGAPGTITRPSAGSGATAGQGYLYTVTQPLASTFMWLVTLAEQYYAPVWTNAWNVLVPTTANAGTVSTAAGNPVSGLLSVGGMQIMTFATAVDNQINTAATVLGNNSFYIYFSDNGQIPVNPVSPPTGYNVQVGFEACFKNSVAPNTL